MTIRFFGLAFWCAVAFVSITTYAQTTTPDKPNLLNSLGKFLQQAGNGTSTKTSPATEADNNTAPVATRSAANNASNPAPVGRRVALVIGNDAYQHVSKLEKAGNDATAMARELKAAGFEVDLRKDVNYKTLLRSIENFTSRINGGDQVVVFYAGHGVQIKSANYLLPIDIEIGSESEIEKTAYSLDDLSSKLA